KAVLLDAEGSHQYSLNVKDESDYKPYKDGEDGVHDKDPHPGIFFVQKALCADRNERHVTDNNDPVDKHIVNNNFGPGLLDFVGNEISYISDLGEIYDIEKGIKSCEKKDQFQVDIFLHKGSKAHEIPSLLNNSFLLVLLMRSSFPSFIRTSASPYSECTISLMESRLMIIDR